VETVDDFCNVISGNSLAVDLLIRCIFDYWMDAIYQYVLILKAEIRSNANMYNVVSLQHTCRLEYSLIINVKITVID